MKSCALIFRWPSLRRKRRVYLVAFMDDQSRFIVSFGLHASQSTALVMEVLRAGIASCRDSRCDCLCPLPPFLLIPPYRSPASSPSGKLATLSSMQPFGVSYKLPSFNPIRRSSPHAPHQPLHRRAENRHPRSRQIRPQVRNLARRPQGSAGSKQSLAKRVFRSRMTNSERGDL